MTFRLNAALAVLAATVALPGIANAQYAPGYRWGPPPAYQDYDEAPPPRYIPNSRDRGYGPTVIQAQPQTSGQSESRVVPGSPGYDQGAIPRPPSAVGGQGGAMAPAAGAAAGPAPGGSVAGLPPEDQPEVGEPKELPARFQRQVVDYPTKEPAGTLVIDTPNTYLYLVLGDGKAMRYGIGVGREGFTWAGAERVSRMAEWPDWHPPTEMIERQPYLPRFMAGGDGNPLGARALYLGKTLYRIHGTNQPSTIGSFVSSGCIRLTNRDIEDLYSRVQVGTRVVVLPGNKTSETASAAPSGGPQVGQGITPATPQGQPLPGYIPSVGAPGSPPSSGPSGITASPLPPAR